MPDTKFYNLMVRFVDSSEIKEANVALKKIWEQGDNIMLDLYFYQNKKSKVIDGAFIRGIQDLNTEKEYLSARELMLDYIRNKYQTQKKEKFGAKLKPFNEIKDDIIILLYIAKVVDYYSEMKKNSIIDYIQKYYENKVITSQFIEGHLQEVNPDRDDFYEALEHLSKKTPEDVEALVQEVVKVCVCDGFLAYEEKVCIAEILQTLRLQGVEPDVGL